MIELIEYRESKDVPRESVLDLYRANHWPSANKPDQLHQALLNSHSLVTAWDCDKLVGLANAISDGFFQDFEPRSTKESASGEIMNTDQFELSEVVKHQ